MAALVPIKVLGYAPGDPVTSVQMNLVNTQLPKAPNFVDGLAEYNPAGLIQVGGAGFRWNGPTLFAGTSATTFANGSTCVWQDGSSSEWQDGSTVTFGDGSLVTVELDCTIELFGGINVRSGGGIINVSSGGVIDFDVGGLITGTASVANTATLSIASGGTLALATGSALTAASGATTTYNAGSQMVLGGTTTVTVAQPTSSQDPGADNRLVGTNLVKAWALISINDGVFVVLDGYNISSVALDGISNFVANIVLARAMANANYAVTYGVGGGGGQRCYANTRSESKLTTGFGFHVQDEQAAAPIDLTATSGIIEVSICVMGRQ